MFVYNSSNTNIYYTQMLYNCRPLMGGISYRANSSCITVDHCTTNTPSTQDLKLINTSTPNPFYLYLSYRGAVNTYKSISKTTNTSHNHTAAFLHTRGQEQETLARRNEPCRNGGRAGGKPWALEPAAATRGAEFLGRFGAARRRGTGLSVVAGVLPEAQTISKH